PLGDMPTIQYLVQEAIASGMREIIIVTGTPKPSIAHHHAHHHALEEHQRTAEKFDLLEKVNHSSQVEIHYIRQKEPKGRGHAVWCARKFIGNEPFAVLLGDDIVQAETPCLRQLIQQYEETQCSVVGVQQVPD